MGFLPSCVHTTIWIQHMDTNKTERERARWELHKNAIFCFEQILEEAPYKTAAVESSLYSYGLLHMNMLMLLTRRHTGKDG